MNKKLYKLMNWPLIEGIVYSEEAHPFSVLGPSAIGANVLFQTFIPNCDNVNLIITSGKTKKSIPMEQADENGFYACLVPGKIPSEYEYEIVKNGTSVFIKDPYAFNDIFTDEKVLSKYTQGVCTDAYSILGAHCATFGGKSGVKFSVWAPNAMRVSVCLESFDYDGRMFPMELNDKFGVYELFIPDVQPGNRYFYEIKIKGSDILRKVDPFGRECICEDGTAFSVVCDDSYEFNDSNYLKKRDSFKELNTPLCAYQINPYDFKKDCTGKEFTETVAKYVLEMGFTHVELMCANQGVNNPDDGICSFYSIDDKFGGNVALKEFTDIMHQNDIGVIFDTSIDRFSRADEGLSSYDGTNLYEHLDPRKGLTFDGKSAVFNFGRNEVKNFVLSYICYLAKEFHIDGFKINNLSDMLFLDYKRNEGEWVANNYGGNENLEATDFIRLLNKTMAKECPDVLMIASEKCAFPYVSAKENEGLYFDMKVNNGMMDDLLSYMSNDSSQRYAHHNELTFSMVYQYSENFVSALSDDLFYLQNKPLLLRMSGEQKDAFSNLRLLLGFMYTHPGRKIVFEGTELGVTEDYFSGNGIDFALTRKNANKGVKNLVKDLNKLYRNNKALYEYDYSATGFEWINSMAGDDCCVSYYRKNKDDNDTIVCVCNFSNELRTIDVGTTLAGKYKELLNTDDKKYSGSNVTNSKAIEISEIGADGLPYHFSAKLAPFSMAVFLYIPFTEEEKYKISKKKEAALAKTHADEYARLEQEALLEFEEAKKRMEEAKAQMIEAEKKAKKAASNVQKELEKAKKALDDAK